MPRDPAQQPDMTQLRAMQPPAPSWTVSATSNYPPSPNPFLRSPLPPSQQTSVDQLRQFYRQGTPQYRLLPLQPNAKAPANSAASGIATTIVNEAINNLPPPTPPVAVTDGLVHGNPIWEFDSAYTILRDDFIPRNSTTIAGELNWNINGNTVNSLGLGGFGGLTPGVVQLYQTNTFANSNSSMTLWGSTGQLSTWFDSAWALLETPGWELTFIFGTRRPYNSFSPAAFDKTHRSLYIGLAAGWPNQFQTRPPVFIGCRYDTDTTAPSINDTTFWLEATTNGMPNSGSTRYNNQGLTFNTGVAPTDGGLHRLDISCASAGVVTLALDGVGSTFTLTPRSDSYNSPGAVTSSNGTLSLTFTPVAASPTDGQPSLAAGSSITFSAVAGTGNVNNINGAWRTLINDGSSALFPIPSISGTISGPFTGTYFPGLMPIIFLGNDSAGGGASNTFALMVDYFAFVWNKGLAGATSVTGSNQPRYW